MAQTNRVVVYQDCVELAQARSIDISTHPQQALQHFERAIKRHPRNLRVYQEACRAFAQRFELRKAHNCIARVSKLASQNQPHINQLAGHMSLDAYRPKQAIEHFKRACRSKQVSPNAHVEFASLLERRGSYLEAAEHVDIALSQQPDDGVTLRLQAHLQTKLGNQDQAERLFRKLSSDDRQDATVRAHALNGWANLLDSQKQYSEAFQKLMESKALQQADSATPKIYERYATEYTILNHAVESLKDTSALCSEPDAQDHPNYLLTGCPRSGSTLIEKVLDAHPEVISADEYNILTGFILPDFLSPVADEDGHFSMADIQNISSAIKNKASAKYHKASELAMGEKIGNRHFIDKNPGLTGHIPAILSMMPGTKIIYTLRDPRDVAISSLFRWLPLNTHSVAFLNPETTTSHIAQELGYWIKLREVLPSETWKETKYENAVVNLEKEVSGILKWMNLSWVDEINDYRKHLTQRGVNSPTYTEVSKPVHQQSVQRWKHYEESMGACFETLSSCIEAF